MAINKIKGICVTGINFGVNREVVKKVADPDEIKHFISIKKALSIDREKRNNWWNEARNNRISKSNFRELQQTITRYEDDLKGYRKAWRCAWADEMTNGLYTVSRKLPPWVLKTAVGKYGYGYARINVNPGDLFLFIGRDKKGDVEFLHQASNFIVKLPRGSGICDSFCKLEENNK